MRTESRDISWNVSKFWWPNQICKILVIFADMSGIGAYFSKAIFALKPWAEAGRFEYHEPYKRYKFCFEL